MPLLEKLRAYKGPILKRKNSLFIEFPIITGSEAELLPDLNDRNSEF